jgi:hypothetical protein
MWLGSQLYPARIEHRRGDSIGTGAGIARLARVTRSRAMIPTRVTTRLPNQPMDNTRMGDIQSPRVTQWGTRQDTGHQSTVTSLPEGPSVTTVGVDIQTPVFEGECVKC